MAKLKVSKVNKLVLFAVVGLLLLGGTAYAAYTLGVKNTKSGQANVNKTDTGSTDGEDSAHLEALESQGGQFFANYKKQIEENTATGTDKTTLYINAALTGAAVDAPEAKDYAKSALEQMTDAMKKDARNKDLIARLEKIAAGNYD